MSPMQAVVRPSVLSVLKNYQHGALSSDATSSPENDSAPSPIYDRQRRAGSTPTRSIPAPGFFRSTLARSAGSTTAIHISSISNNNNNNVSKVRSQQTKTSSSRSSKTSTENVRDSISRRTSSRVGLTSTAGGLSGRMPPPVSVTNKAKAQSTNPSKVSDSNPTNTRKTSRVVLTRPLAKGDTSKPGAALTSGINSKVGQRKVSAPAAPVTRKVSTVATTKASVTNTKVGNVSSSGRITTASNRATASSSAKNYNQPDLVKVSSPGPRPDLQRENDQLRKRLSHSAKGFTAMAIALNHFTKEFNNPHTSRLLQEIHNLKQQIRDQNDQIAQLQEHYRQELLQYKDCLTQTEIGFRLSELQDQHKSFVEKLLLDHQAELDTLKESHRLDLLQLESEQEEVVRQLEARRLTDLNEAELRWKTKVEQSFEYKSDELMRQESDFERREEQWAECKRALEEQIHLLKAEIKEKEEEKISKCKGDSLLRSTTNKLAQITQEAESLKAVLEMKSEECRGLRADKIRLEEKLTEFDQMKVALQKASALAEDLKAQIDAKNDLERKLSFENRRLHQSMEREIHEKKKLWQEKEELQWKVRQSMSGLDGALLSSSMIDYPSSPNPMFTSLQQQCLSASYTEAACPQSLPPFVGKGLSKVSCHRPVSAPPGKFDVFSKCFSTSTPHHDKPDSPRVMEVVEKTESVSWKLEYNEGEMDLCSASPKLKRKLSPHSPLTFRKNTRKPHGDVMTRSLMDNSSRGSPCPPGDVMVRSCVSLSRSNSRGRRSLPFETLSESLNESVEVARANDTKETHLEHFDSRAQCVPKPAECKSRNRSGSERSSMNSYNLSSISDEEDIGDVSSSSEVESNEPVLDVTTPQIEAMQFMFPGEIETISGSKHISQASSPDGELTLRDELSMATCQKTKKSVMSKSMQVKGPAKGSLMCSSLPSYDLKNLFKAPESLQDSGGESLMARCDEEDSLISSGMTDSTESDPESMPHQGDSRPDEIIEPPLHSKKSALSLTESLSGVNWPTDFDQLP